MRSVLSSLLELVGAAAVVAAAWLADPRLALALAGAVLVAAGYIIGDPRRRKG